MKMYLEPEELAILLSEALHARGVEVPPESLRLTCNHKKGTVRVVLDIPVEPLSPRTPDLLEAPPNSAS